MSHATTARIVGEFHAQQDVPLRDIFTPLFDQRFDATRAVLSMPFNELVELRDCDESSDHIGRAHVLHDGPCSVYIQDAICAFFGIDDIEDLTEAMLEHARSVHATELQAPRQWRVRACIEYLVTAEAPAHESGMARQIAARLSGLEGLETIDDITVQVVLATPARGE